MVPKKRLKAKNNKTVANTQAVARNNAVNIRNVNVGMFSGPRTSYQRYNLSNQSIDAIRRTGA